MCREIYASAAIRSNLTCQLSTLKRPPCQVLFITQEEKQTKGPIQDHAEIRQFLNVVTVSQRNNPLRLHLFTIKNSVNA